MNPARNRTRVVLAWLAVFLLGVLAGMWGYYSERGVKLDDLARAARGRSLIMSVPGVASLTGTRADEGTRGYAEMQQRLDDALRITRNIAQAGLMRYRPEDKGMVCLVCSARDGSREDLMRPGDRFPIPVGEEAMTEVLRGGIVFYNESLADDHGRWVAAYARIGDGSDNAFLQLKISSRIWHAGLVAEAFVFAAFAWLLFGMPLAVYLLARRDARKSRYINMLSAAIEQSQTAVVIMDRRGVIQYVNPCLCALSRHTREELIGRHYMAATEGVPAESLARFLEAFNTGKTMSGVMRCTGKAGRVFDALVTTTPVFDRHGEIIASCCVLVDVSELERQAAILREAKEKAEESGKAKGVFLATMGHEVRTPLNGICGFADLLIETDLNEEQREYARAIRESSSVLLKLAGNILDFSRLDAGCMQLAMGPAGVRALVADVFGSVREAAAAKGVRLASEISPGVPELVMADEMRLRQVLVNLVGNAVKFTPEGEVTVMARVRGEESPGAWSHALRAKRAGGGAGERELILEFAVRDTGIGIAPEDQVHLFKPFKQLDSSRARHYEGAGLGLVISFDLVRLMGGSISVESEKGAGSTFSFYIVCGRARENVCAERV